MLDRSAVLREKALAFSIQGVDGEDPVNDYAISTWVWLGRLFARTRPAFWQGRNRWLGGAAFPEVFSIHTNVVTIGPSAPPQQEPQPSPPLLDRVRGLFGLGGTKEQRKANDPAVAQMIAAAQEQTRKQSATGSAPALRELIESTAVLVPALAVDNWEKSLPKAGEGNCVSGAVKHARLDSLVEAVRSLKASNTIPYETGTEWVEIVVAAAIEAKRTDSHLVEGDDSIYAACRWPATDQSSTHQRAAPS